MTRWLADRPVAAYLLLGFGISYLIGFPALMAYSAWAPPQPRVLQTYVSRLLVVQGPGIAALLLTMLTRGRPGVMGLVARLVPRRADLPWAVGILLAGVISSGVAFALAGVALGHLASTVRSAGVLLAAHFFLQFVIVSIGEELGWRGWLLPRLLERHSRLRATLLTAAAWGLWHGPLLLSSPLTTALFLFAVLGLSFLFTWIWAHSGERLFLIVLAHATVNTPIFFWEEAAAVDANTRAATSAWSALEVMYAVAACGLVLGTWRWWVQGPRTTDAQAPSSINGRSPA